VNWLRNETRCFRTTETIKCFQLYLANTVFRGIILLSSSYLMSRVVKAHRRLSRGTESRAGQILTNSSFRPGGSRQLSVRKQRNNTVQDLGVVLFRCLRLVVPYCVAVLSVGVGTHRYRRRRQSKCQDRPN
jgi:hypothetical protein